MSYVVLARKWRPQSFEDLVGQEHVSRTLANAIATKRVAHAFLFTGVRGVGKTTCARILAKALNCLGDPKSTPQGSDPGPTATPCLVCAACREIAEGIDVDVREIDGASYNGVDEVRKLQDALPYRPNRDRYKIFIIDEVHMLSQNAWNAFLKTLEEPPPHVKFIFATTEAHKVPITILSRVQRFDFKLLSPSLIAKRLRYVLEREGIASDDASISILARQAEGSMRDAMSLLDQALAYNESELLGADVSRLLGVASHRVIYDLVEGVLKGEIDRALALIQDFVNQGFDLGIVARDLLHALRDLVVVRACREPDQLLEQGAIDRQRLGEIASHYEVDDLLRTHQGFSRNFDDVVKASSVRAALEMLLLRLARRPPLVPVDHLIERLENLERRLLGGQAPEHGGSSGGAQARNERRDVRPRGARALPVEATPFQEAPAPLEPAPIRPAPSTERANGHQEPASETQDQKLNPALASTAERWRLLVEALRLTRPELAAFVAHARAIEVSDEALVLGFEKNSVLLATLEKPENLEALTAVAKSFFGKAPKISFTRLEALGAPSDSLAQQRLREQAEREKLAISQARQHPLVTQTARVLGARVKSIRLPGGS